MELIVDVVVEGEAVEVVELEVIVGSVLDVDIVDDEDKLDVVEVAFATHSSICALTMSVS